MSYNLVMPIDEYVEAVAKENARLNNRIEKLEAALRNVAVTLDSEEIPYMVRNRHACATAKEALEGKDE